MEDDHGLVSPAAPENRPFSVAIMQHSDTSFAKAFRCKAGCNGRADRAECNRLHRSKELMKKEHMTWWIMEGEHMIPIPRNRTNM